MKINKLNTNKNMKEVIIQVDEKDEELAKEIVALVNEKYGETARAVIGVVKRPH